MAVYRIHRMKDAPREQFRWAPHTSGLAIVKMKDYELGGQVEAANLLSAWKQLQQEDEMLRPGDLLEDESGKLKILKYIGFEDAQWFVPELKADVQTIASEAAAS